MWRIFGWVLVLLTALGVWGWWQVEQIWQNRNTLLANKLREQLQTLLPEWDIRFEEFALRDDASVEIKGISCGVRGESTILMDIAAVELTLDRVLFARDQQVVLTEVIIRQPRLLVSRDAEGAWNWQELPPLPRSERPLPAISIEQGLVLLQFAETADLPGGELRLSPIHAHLTPVGFKEFSVRGEMLLDRTGTVAFAGDFSLINPRWKLGGHCDQLQTADQLLSLADRLSPQVRQGIEGLVRSAGQRRAAPGATPFDAAGIQTAEVEPGIVLDGQPEAGSSPTAERPLFRVPQLGLALNLNLAFDLECRGPGQPLDYRVRADVRDGVIDHPALPIPLRNLSGKFYCDRSIVVVQDLRAANGPSELFLNGQFSRSEAAGQTQFDLKAQQLRFGPELRNLLRGSILKVYDSHQPQGTFDLDVSVALQADGTPRITLRECQLIDCQLLPDTVQLPVTGIQGKVWQQEENFFLQATGVVAGRPATAEGWLRNPGPELTMMLQLKSGGLPIDETTIAAFVAPQLQGARKALDQLQLRGLAEVAMVLVKTGVPGQKLKVKFEARVSQGRCNFVRFPYGVTDLSGRVRFDALTEDLSHRDVWYFEAIQGRHGESPISGQGSFGIKAGRGLLDLKLSATNVPIDVDLQQACVTANPQLEELFQNIQPGGEIDLENIRILWSPGGGGGLLPHQPAVTTALDPAPTPGTRSAAHDPSRAALQLTASPQPAELETPPAPAPGVKRDLIVIIPSMEVSGARFKLKGFPYEWEQVDAVVAWEQGEAFITSLTGWHGRETNLQITSSDERRSAVLSFPEGGTTRWHLHLEDVRIRKLVADSTFRRALPQSVAAVVDKINPRGQLDLNCGLDLKGSRAQPDLVTAAWELQVNFPKNDLTFGVDMSDVSGWVDIPLGIWDGKTVRTEGAFEIEQARVFDLPVTRLKGPFKVEGNQILIGMPDWGNVVPNHDDATNRYADKEVRAEIYGGQIGLNAMVQIDPWNPEETQYRLGVTLRDAKLEQWAQDAGWQRERLQGPMNGAVQIVGKGSSDRTIQGDGWIQISPARLYELPVMARVFSALNMQPQQESTAFEYAHGDFQIHDGVVDFKLIDLVGKTLRLVGRGSVAFGEGLNQRVQIDFFRSAIRNNLWVVGPLVQALTTNTIGVRVRGTVSNPVTEVQPKLGVVDDVFRGMIDSFNQGVIPTAPRRTPGLSPPFNRTNALP